jgi:hypothetical protein
VTVTSHFTLQLSAPSSMAPGANGTLVAVLTPVPGSSPSPSLSYLAPGSIPTQNPVPVTVSDATNPSLSTSAEITVVNHVVVSVLPNTATLPPNPLSLPAAPPGVTGIYGAHAVAVDVSVVSVQVPAGTIQPPPKISPGPREARNTGRRCSAGCEAA